MGKYKIKSVIDHEGNLKPERIGRIVVEPILLPNDRAYAEYVCLADGTPYSGKALVTSEVIEWNEYYDYIHIVTENSEYIFEEVAD